MKFIYDWFSHNIPHWEKYLAHLKAKKNVKVLEVGCFEGRATVWLLENILTSKSTEITVIDTFQGGMENLDHHDKISNLKKRFMTNISQWRKRVKVLTGYSYNHLRSMKVKPTFDFIYIDGSHMAKDVLEDAVLCWRLLKVGGIMTFDDYRDWNFYSDPILCPKLAIESFMTIYKNQYEIVDVDYQMAIRKLGDNLVLDKSRPTKEKKDSQTQKGIMHSLREQLGF